MNTVSTTPTGTLQFCLKDAYGAQAAIAGAPVQVFSQSPASDAAGETYPPVQEAGRRALVCEGVTDSDGYFTCDLPEGSYTVEFRAFGLRNSCEGVTITRNCTTLSPGSLPIGFSLDTCVPQDDCTQVSSREVRQGRGMYVRVARRKSVKDFEVRVTATRGALSAQFREYDHDDDLVREHIFGSQDTIGVVRFTATLRDNPLITVNLDVTVLPNVQNIAGDVKVTMRRAATEVTEDLPLWVVIRKSTEAISFDNYFRFMNHVLCGEALPSPVTQVGNRIVHGRRRFDELQKRRFLPFTDADGYRILKVATEAFLIVHCGVALADFDFVSDREGDLADLVRRVGTTADLGGLWDRYLKFVNGTSDRTLPYLALIRDKLRDVRLKDSLFEDADLPQECFGILRHKLTEPCLLELIWSYWHEEGMLVQTVNTIARRFQNVRGRTALDPLANLEIDPLRPLNNLFWGYIQDEQHRLSVVRRGYEYDHHYGLRLYGKAVPELRPADSRSKFLEAFHNLLHLCIPFYKQDDDTTVVADGFPILNALKEVHLILSQGAHNQFGDLPSTARIEMLMQQWLLARPEFREFLPTRIMVAYPEPWMDRVDAMKKLQGWTDVSVLHFRNLAMFGEQILLSVRYGAWSDVNDPVQAANWARFWRPEIQGYIHAYRAVTGVDLTSESVDFTLPAVYLRKRLARQQRVS
jgi:hypothetical protein